MTRQLNANKNNITRSYAKPITSAGLGSKNTAFSFSSTKLNATNSRGYTNTLSMKMDSSNRFLTTSSKSSVFQSSFLKSNSNKLVRGGMPLFAMKQDAERMQNLPEAAQKEFMKR